MRARFYVLTACLLATSTACTAQGYDRFPPFYPDRPTERRDDGRRYDDRRFDERRDERRYDDRRDERRYEEDRRPREQDGRRQQQFNQNVASLQQQHNQGVVALQQQFNQGRINRAQLDAGYRDLQATLDRRIAEERRAAGQ